MIYTFFEQVLLFLLPLALACQASVGVQPVGRCSTHPFRSFAFSFNKHTG